MYQSQLWNNTLNIKAVIQVQSELSKNDQEVF